MLSSNVQVLDVISQNPAWTELIEILTSVNDEHMLPQIESLLNIRNVTGTEDYALAEASLRMIGVNLNSGLMRKQALRLAAAFDTVTQYEDTMDSGFWDAFAANLIDDLFEVTRLWTADYRTFYRGPQGKTIADGGTWYPTTHMEVEIGASSVDAGFDLVIDFDMVPEIVELLVNGDWMEEDAAREWASNHVGLQLNNSDLHKPYVRAYIFGKRISEFFYQWAPIEDVLESIVIVTQASCRILYGARLVCEPTIYNSVGAARELTEESGFEHGNTTLRSGERFTFAYVTKYEGGATKYEEAHCLSTEIATHGVGWCVFNTPDTSTVINVTLAYGEKRQVVAVRLGSNVNVVDPLALSISASNPAYGGRRVPFRALAQYPNGGTVDITEDSGFLHWESDLGTFDGATLVLPEALADTVAHVKCTYVGVAREMTATFDLKVLKSVAARLAVGLELLVPAQVPQGQNFEVDVFATFNDGSREEVRAVLYSSTNKIDIQDSTVVSSIQAQDYLAVVAAEYQTPGGPRLVRQRTVKLTAKRWGVVATRVRMPDRLIERSRFNPEAQLYIVDLDAPVEEVAAGNPLYVRGWRTAHGCRWYGVTGSDYGALVPHPITGEFTAPIVDSDTKFGIGFTAQFNGLTVSGFKSVVVYDELLQLSRSDIVMNTFLPNGTVSNLRSFGLWNSGITTILNAEYTVTFIPSESARLQAEADVLAEIQRRLDAGEDASDLDPQNPDYSQYVELTFRDSLETDYDPVKEVAFPRKLLHYAGALHGTARVHSTYEHNGKEVQSSLALSLSPLRSRVLRITLESPSVVGERSRTFVQAKALMDSGKSEYVAATWSAEWYEDDQYVDLIAFSARDWNGYELAAVLESKEFATFEEFLAAPCSRLPIFASVVGIDSLKKLVVTGAVMQVDRVTEMKIARITARYYNVVDQLDLTVTPAIPTPINTITNSYIIGPTEVQSNQLYASYALVNTYAMTGDLVLLDGTEVDGSPYEFEMEVSSDWIIMSSELLVGTEYVPAPSAIASVDGDGYLRPLQNVEGRILLRAVFNDNFNKFSRDVVVHIHKVNTYLLELDVLGQTEVSDSPAGNPTVEYVDGLWYVPYNLRLVTADLPDGILVPSTKALWSMVGPLSLAGVSIGENNGRLYVTAQKSDASLTLRATLDWPKPDGTMETIVGLITVQIQASRGITTAYIDFTDANISPDTDIQMVMVYERRNQDVGDSLHPVVGIEYQWALRPPLAAGVTLSSTGVLRFRPSALVQDAVVECTLTEDRTKITEAIRVSCPGVGYPTVLNIEGFKRIRDDSRISLKGIVKRAAKPETDETSNCFWSLRNEHGDEVTFAGVSIDPSTGMLTSARLSEDSFPFVHCLFIEGKIRLEATHQVHIVSSMPFYGEAAFGVNTLEEVLALRSRLNAIGGGSFIIDARGDEYGYFCCRESFGNVELLPSALPNGTVNNSYEGWDGASWTLSNFNGRGPIFIGIEYDNIQERLALYRTNKRAGMLAKFTVKYLKP